MGANFDSASISFFQDFRFKNVIYLLSCGFVLLALFALPFIYTNISVQSTGIVRPAFERTEIKTGVTSSIEKLYVSEGDIVDVNTPLARMRNPYESSRNLQNAFEQQQRLLWIKDLEFLTQGDKIFNAQVHQIKTPHYRQQLSKFLYLKAEQEGALRKVKNDIDINTLLIADKIIAPKEDFDKRIEWERLNAAFSAFITEQQAIWEQELANLRIEYGQLQTQLSQWENEDSILTLRAPVGGTIQGIQTRYAGMVLISGETLCTISPETYLVGECYVPTRDAGLLQNGMLANFQLDAFDYNYFGLLTGRIFRIDNDFTLLDNLPVYKVVCHFDSIQLKLKNGYSGKLKKGLTFQARFLVARRTLWQLLWDKLDDWMNPSAPPPL